METFWFDFLSKQLPVIVVLGIFCYGMYKYFIAVISKKDQIIEDKDDEIKELHRQLLDLTTKCLQVIDRNTDAINVIKRL